MNIVQVFFVLLLIGPIVWGIFNLKRYKGVSQPDVTVSFKTLINSGVLYALAYNLIFFLQELFLVLGKKAIGLEAYLYHNNHTWNGEHPMASLMQGSGALAIFVLGLLFLLIYKWIKKSGSIWKLLVLWLAFHGLIQSLPQVTVAYFDPGTDVGEALVGYLNLNSTLLIFLAILSVLAIASVAVRFGGLLLGFAPQGIDLSNPKVRFKYVRFVAVGAALLGSVLIIPFRLPPLSQIIAPFFVLAISIPWMWSSVNVSGQIERTSNTIDEKIHWMPIGLLFLLLVFFQLILAPGVKF